MNESVRVSDSSKTSHFTQYLITSTGMSFVKMIHSESEKVVFENDTVGVFGPLAHHEIARPLRPPCHMDLFQFLLSLYPTLLLCLVLVLELLIHKRCGVVYDPFCTEECELEPEGNYLL